MQLKLPSRLRRGVLIALAIILAHIAIASVFMQMRVDAPDLGPVLTFLLDESRRFPEEAVPEGPGQAAQPDAIPTPSPPPAAPDPQPAAPTPPPAAAPDPEPDAAAQPR